ncbi:MAG: cell surface protein SprA, partial [Bacteroidales bacterium]
ARNTARLLIGLKSVSGSYTETNGTSLSGYNRGTKFLGMSGDAPGVPFILGDQSENNIRKMVERDWIVSSTLLQTNLLQTTTKTISFRANYEPFTGVRVELNTNYSRSINKNASYLAFRNDTNYLLHFAKPNISGNFSMTIISLRSFENLNANNYNQSKFFAKFKENRYRIIARLQEKYANYPSYQYDPVTEPGFKENSQQVLIPAFLATYGDYNPNSFTLDLFPSLMYVRPNWRVNITSLTQIPLLAEYFQSINISHAYASTYNIGSYITNSLYQEGPDGFSNVRDQLGNYAPMYDVSAITINEQFSPLFGVDVTLKNNLTARFEFKKSRTVMLGLTNYTLNENYATEYVIGSGYRFPNIPLTMITFGAVNSPVKSDLDLRADISIRDDLFFIRRLDIADQKVTNGNKNIKVSFTADYQLSDRLTLQAFYDRLLTDPHISSSYKTINTKFGFSIRFTLTQ